jgi:protein-S-isoprenylcysteine O-methyltransferase Ste14
MPSICGKSKRGTLPLATGRAIGYVSHMITATAAKIVWLLGIVVWFAVRYPFQRRARRLGIARHTGGRGDRIVLAIAAVGQFIVPALYVAVSLAGGQSLFGDYPFHPAQGWFGLMALVAALVLFRVTHKQLGRNWSVTLETRTAHKLVTDGVYAWVRHPMYTSFLLSALAQALLLPNWIAGPIGLVAFGILFFYRARREEALMIDTFGDGYRDFMRRTARIVPWIY